jgi:hypothetical protein
MSSSSDNNKTYIGHIKSKNGGIKVIPGQKDNSIITKRNKILNHLDIVLSGGKSLKEKNIKKYFQALGGKYVRNDMCISGDNSNCKSGRSVSVKGAHKLLKLISKKDLPINSALETFKGSAPQLYEKLETKIKGGYNAISYDDNNYKGGIDERASGSRSKALQKATELYPVTSFHLKERAESQKSCDEYYNDVSEDIISENAHALLNEMDKTRIKPSGPPKMYIPVICYEWAGMLSALIKSDGTKNRSKGWHKLCDLFNNIKEAKDYTAYVRKDYSNENVYDIITDLSKEYLCNGGEITKPSRSDPTYDFYDYQVSIIKAIRFLRDKDTDIDVISKKELTFNPFPIKNTQEFRDVLNHTKTKCSGGGYDEREYDNRGGYDEREYDNRGGYDEREYDNRGGYDRYYSDNMHGGELGLFRNEIGRSFNNLRQSILSINL